MDTKSKRRQRSGWAIAAIVMALIVIGLGLIPASSPVSPPISIVLLDVSGKPINSATATRRGAGFMGYRRFSEDRAINESGTIDFPQGYERGNLLTDCFYIALAFLPFGDGQRSDHEWTSIDIHLPKGSADRPGAWAFDPRANGIRRFGDYDNPNTDDDECFVLSTRVQSYLLTFRDSEPNYRISMIEQDPLNPRLRKYELRFQWNESVPLQELYRRHLADQNETRGMSKQ